MPDVGIDAIGFYSSNYFLDLKTLAEKRGIEPSKFYVGLDQHKMAVPPPGEDIISMAANAAVRVINGDNQKNIDHLFFATESGIDFSKSAGTYLHSLLGLADNCRTIELKQACYSATAAIALALPLIREQPDRKVLIIAADIARYGLETSGESSQGGGAIALLLSANPKLLTIEAGSGFYTKDVMDFWRPYYREEALVDGKYSCDVYLQVLLETWSHYSKLTGNQYENFARFCYHAPVPALVEKAHRLLAKRNNTILDKEKSLSELQHALHYNRIVGNSYTAALYISLLSLLDNDPNDLSGQRIGLYSYGSGCVGEFFAMKVQPGYRQHLDTAWNQSLLKNRLELSYEQYEHFYNFGLPTDGSDYLLPNYNTGLFRLSKISQHKRIYEQAGAKSPQLPSKKPREHRSLTVRTPGKLILSGEHAVVYGNPAIAMAINLYTETTISGYAPAEQKNILFNLLDFRYHQAHSLSTLRRLKRGIQDKYQKFLQGQYGIRDVLKEPIELMQFAVTHLIDNRKVQLPQGIEVRTSSTIPMGCGMGSSAAAVVSSMFAVAQFSNLEMDLESCYQLAWEAENMQHGYSSGVDVYLVLHGGCIRFQKHGPKETRPVPKRQFYLINTGSPISNTGECVAAAARYLKNDAGLLNEFANVTNQIDRALQLDDNHLIVEGIRENNQLLIKLGVVPSKVQRFIAEIEKQGGAAKTCGAGAVLGEAAGAVLVSTNEDPADLVQDYGYQQFSIEAVSHGTHIV
ncbi:MAG: hydroxymethylglutaryl-CoA synthase [Proteobacteria bacterium]|nr:hydroxymethylglutaryl-CoA synthase [Pseudomonadota bacterium]